MALSIFEHSDYKRYLNTWLKAQPRKGFGLRKRLAEAISTQTGFITQVLSGEGHFSPEQALAIADYLKHSEDERRYFLLMVQYTRAGTAAYRHHVRQELTRLREQNRNLSQRLEARAFASTPHQQRYFSSWLNACVHVMCTCTQYRDSPERMAKDLNLPLPQVHEVLQFLCEAGWLQKKGARYEAGQARLHLGKDSPYMRQHHLNWNLRALQSLERPQEDLHYSSVVTLASDDVYRLYELFTNTIKEFDGIVNQSEGEKVYATTLNFFDLLAQR